MHGAIDISIANLSISFIFVFIAGVLSVVHELKLEKDLITGTIRAIVQLTAMGYLLKIIFGLKSAVLVVALFIAMTFFAAKIVKGRVKKQKVSYFMPTLMAVQINFFLITFILTEFIIQANPWWTPQYFIPLGGMIAGNSMNALSISLSNFFADLKTKRNEVEMKLCLGASAKEASRSIFRDALKTGMIPSINNMMGAGIVSIPGMMTGQILAGSDPIEAVKYQIMVMLMLTASTAIASFTVLTITLRRSFGKYGNLLV